MIGSGRRAVERAAVAAMTLCAAVSALPGPRALPAAGARVPLGSPCELPLSTPAMEDRMRRLGASPRSLAIVDLDADGVPDLIAGYAGRRGGLLVVFRGNERARFPDGQGSGSWSCTGLASSPFDPAGTMVDVPRAPDFLVTGDFDGDGARDVVVGTRASRFSTFLRGDRRGGFLEAKILDLGGGLTALGSGELGPPDGRTELAAAVARKGGPSLLVYDETPGRQGGSPDSFPLPEEAAALAFAPIGPVTRSSIVVAAGRHVVIVDGDDDRDARALRATSDVMLASRAVGLATGRFRTEGPWGDQIAVVTEDGALQVLERHRPSREGADERSRPSLEAADGAGSDRPDSTRTFEAVPPTPIAGWTATRAVAASARGLGLLSWKATARRSGHDLLLLDGSRLGIVGAWGEGPPELLEAFPESDRRHVVAALGMRLNEDALDDLVVLSRDRSTPLIVPTVPGATFTVNTLNNIPDASVGNGICATGGPSPRCSLLAALQEANAAVSPPTTIVFNVGSGTPVINTSFSYTLVKPVTIDGATGGATRIAIQGGGFALSGTGAVALRSLALQGGGGGGIGVDISTTSSSVVENCLINGFQTGVHLRDIQSWNNTIGGSTTAARNVISANWSEGIYIEDEAYGNAVLGNFIGTNAFGDAASGNGIGIRIWAETHNTVGGPTLFPGAPPGNVISGNGDRGLELLSITGGNTVQGNLVGLRADGSAALGNGGTGIVTYWGDYIGGTTSAERNVISGNGGNGVEGPAFPETYPPVVVGCFIGTAADGTTPVPNAGNGILSHGTVSIGGAFNTTPGGCTGSCNVIAFNGGAGVRVTAGPGTWIAYNSVHSNGGLGIDLDPAGPTPNDAGDGDSGPNGLQNFPVVTRAVFTGSDTTITGVLSSAPSTTYMVQLFGNTEADPSGSGEGRTYLATLSVTTEGSGAGAFTTTVPGNIAVITATATSPSSSYSTSEFSPAFFNPGEASRAGTLRAARGAGTSVDVSFTPACGASNHAVYRGEAGPAPMSGLFWTGADCGLGTSGTASFDSGPLAPGRVLYFVMVGQTAASEGSYGRDAAGVERPEATGIGACDVGQSLTASCDP